VEPDIDIQIILREMAKKVVHVVSFAGYLGLLFAGILSGIAGWWYNYSEYWMSYVISEGVVFSIGLVLFIVWLIAPNAKRNEVSLEF
jgi:hypothetical protein